MAIEITNTSFAMNVNVSDTQAVTRRITEPLASPFSMVTEIVRDERSERVTVPGVIVSDPEFVAGYYWGRVCYFDSVDDILVNGEKVVSLTDDQLRLVQCIKTRDVSDQDVIKFMMETAETEEVSQWDTEPTTPGWRAGLIFGYVSACSDEYYGMACYECGAHKSHCHH